MTNQLSLLKSRLETEKEARREVEGSLQSVQKNLDARSSEVSQTEAEKADLQGKHDATNTSAKDLTAQKQAVEEKNAKLSRSVAEKEKELEEVTSKFKTLTAQYNHLAEQNSRKRAMSGVSESTTDLVEAQSEEVLLIKQSMAKEQSTLQNRLDTEVRHSIELDEQLIKAQKEKAKIEVEMTQLERQLLSETQLYHGLEEQAARQEENFTKLSGNSAGVHVLPPLLFTAPHLSCLPPQHFLAHYPSWTTFPGGRAARRQGH